MYVCVYVSAFIKRRYILEMCVYPHDFMYIYMSVCTYICLYVFEYVCMYIHMSVCIWICLYVYTHVCMYVHMTCIYIHMSVLMRAPPHTDTYTDDSDTCTACQKMYIHTGYRHIRTHTYRSASLDDTRQIDCPKIDIYAITYRHSRIHIDCPKIYMYTRLHTHIHTYT